MKTIKKLSFFLFSGLFLVSLASCTQDKAIELLEENNNLSDEVKVGTNDNDLPLIDMTDNSSATKLSSISIITTNAKTEFNMGEKIDHTGIVVKGNYISQGSASQAEVTKNYYFDDQFVNVDASGVYPVYVYYREGSRVVSNYYNVTIRSSFLVESGEEYIAGLEVTGTDGETRLDTIDLYLGDTFAMPQIQVYRHYYEGTVETQRKITASTASKLKIDTSAVDTSKVGTYLVRVSYASTVTISGSVYDNKVSCFIMVNVTNPVSSITWVSGETTLSATSGTLDTSSWRISVDRLRGGAEETGLDSKFSVTGIDKLVPGTYTANITLISDGFSMQKDITIVESTTETITRFLDFSPLIGTFSSSDMLGNTGYFYALSGTVVDAHAPSATDAPAFNGLSFAARYKLSGTGNQSSKNLKVVMPSAGTITLYFTTGSNGVERTMRLYDANGNILEEVNTATYCVHTFTVSEAGSYFFASKSSGMNIYGVIATVEKVGA